MTAQGQEIMNLWWMKQWYVFYTGDPESQQLLSTFGDIIKVSAEKLNQVGSEIRLSKLTQVGSESPFPSMFAFVPWRHHVLIMQKSKTVDEALFYIRHTIEKGWSRSALDDNIRADLYHISGGALTNFSDRLPTPQGKLAQELLKESYDLSFISLPEGYDEKALEDAMINSTPW